MALSLDMCGSCGIFLGNFECVMWESKLIEWKIQLSVTMTLGQLLCLLLALILKNAFFPQSLFK